MDIQQALDLLAKTGQYVVLKKYEYIGRYFENVTQEPTRLGVVIDTETTGFELESNEVINIGLVQFRYGISGKIYEITKTYEGFQEPSKPLTATITRITGLTDEFLKGKKINDDIVNQILSESDIAIAHHAGFDRQFVDRSWVASRTINYACSSQQIPWYSNGFTSRKLETLCQKYGFVYDAHLALPDCLALIHLLTHELAGRSLLAYLLDSIVEKYVLIKALRTEFKYKELIKNRDYTWNFEGKYWSIVLPEDKAMEELEWLRSVVYEGLTDLPWIVDRMERVDLFKSS